MMKSTLTTTAFLLSCVYAFAGSSLKDDLKKNADKPEKLNPVEVMKKHAKDSQSVARDQDELSADVQDLIQDQTNKEVIDLLTEAEQLMGEATERLEAKKTGGDTIAIETEIIEKIFEAAKQKQQQGQGQGQQQSNSMLDRMRQMMGKEPGEQEGKEGEGNQPGQGSEGDSDKENDPKKNGSADNTKEERTVPKNTSAPSKLLPREEQRALDAYKKATSK